jgi:hypothetical protein
MKNALLTAGLALLLASASPAFAQSSTSSSDPLAAIQSFTLADVQAAQAIYAANPTVPTYGAATQCLGYLNTTLSATGAPSVGVMLSAPVGVASAVADLDVALNAANNGLPTQVVAFNQNCAPYVEDLKAEAAKLAASNFTIFGLKL